MAAPARRSYRVPLTPSCSRSFETHVEDVRCDIALVAERPAPENPRRITDAHPSLPGWPQTIKSVGQLQPIVGAQGPTPGWMILAGERRWRAARLAGLAEVLEARRRRHDEQAFTS
jgi:ParB family chromosome partitioning protein